MRMKWNFLKSSKNQYEKENNSMKMRLQVLTKIKSGILKDGRNIFFTQKVWCSQSNITSNNASK